MCKSNLHQSDAFLGGGQSTNGATMVSTRKRDDEHERKKKPARTSQSRERERRSKSPRAASSRRHGSSRSRPRSRSRSRSRSPSRSRAREQQDNKRRHHRESRRRRRRRRRHPPSRSRSPSPTRSHTQSRREQRLHASACRSQSPCRSQDKPVQEDAPPPQHQSPGQNSDQHGHQMHFHNAEASSLTQQQQHQQQRWRGGRFGWAGATGVAGAGGAARAGRGGRGGRGPGGFRSKKLSIPDNWEDVPKMGDLMHLTPFVALRVPLDDKYTMALKRHQDHWSPQDFCQEQLARALNIRLLIDLTNTFRYYNGSEAFQHSTIEYVKLRIEGFKQPPSEQDVTRFMEIVEQFQVKDPDARIGVHCTHGLNRTGYLIVSYLVRKCGWTVTKALEAFALARPPGLIKHQYVTHLYHLFGQENEQVVLPKVPDWAEKKYASVRASFSSSSSSASTMAAVEPTTSVANPPQVGTKEP